MDVFANFVLQCLSNFKSEENSVNCLSKKPILKSIFRRSVFCTLIPYCISLVNCHLFLTFACVLGFYYLELG